MTLADVEREAGVPVYTVEAQYATKEALLAAVLVRQMNDVLGWVRHWVEQCYTVQGKLDTFISVRNGMLSQYGSLQGFAFGMIGGVSEPMYRKLRKAFDAQQENIVSDILTFGVARGHVKDLAEDDYEMWRLSWLVCCGVWRYSGAEKRDALGTASRECHTENAAEWNQDGRKCWQY